MCGKQCHKHISSRPSRLPHPPSLAFSPPAPPVLMRNRLTLVPFFSPPPAFPTHDRHLTSTKTLLPFMRTASKGGHSPSLALARSFPHPNAISEDNDGSTGARNPGSLSCYNTPYDRSSRWIAVIDTGHCRRLPNVALSSCQRARTAATAANTFARCASDDEDALLEYDRPHVSPSIPLS